MSDLSFDINGDPLPKSKPSKRSSTTGVRVIRTPSPSNLATTIVTHKPRPSSSASSHSTNKSIHLVTGPTGTVVGDLQDDTVAIIDRPSSTSPNRQTTARRGSSSTISTASKRSYRINRDRQSSPAQDLQFDADGSIVDKARSRRRRNCSKSRSTGPVADPTGTVVKDLKADTTPFVHSPPRRGRHRDRRLSQHSSSNNDSSKTSYRIVKVPKEMALMDLRFDTRGNIIDEHAKHHHRRHHRSRSARSHSPEDHQRSTAPLLRSGPSSPVALYDAVFGDSSEPVRTDKQGSSSSSATSISSGYVETAGKTRRSRRRGGRA